MRHVLSAIEGHFISGYGDAEDNPGKLKLDAAERAEAFLKDHPATQARFDQVAKLIDGFETPFGLELLATVHWIARQEKAVDVSEAVAKVYGWNDRKQMFKEKQIRLAWEVLQRQGWLLC